MSTIGKLVFVLVLGLTACGGDTDDPGERPSGYPLGKGEDPHEMTEAEHHDAACDEIAEIRQSVMSGDLRVTGDQLDYINSHASAAGDDALEEAADDSDPQDRRWRRPGN